MRAFRLALLTFSALAAGCSEGPARPSSAPGGQAGAPPPPAPAVAPAPPAPAAPSVATSVAPPAPPAPATVESVAAAQGQTTLKKAEVGAGRQGRGYGGGIVTEPVRQKFRAEQSIVLNIQIPQAMNTYKALNERGPRTHEEFMKDIIAANAIRLPALPPDERYLFDPKTQELMVERTTGPEQ